MTIHSWLQKASTDLSNVSIDSASLDAQLLLSAVLYQPREYLLAHDDQKLSKTEINQANKWLQRRLKREPIAYILGHKEFYGRDFIVSPNVLIPRPESETIIDILKDLNPATIIDIGTGSGCLALSAKLEIPNSHVIATDISEAALQIARLNTSSLNTEITLAESDLLSGVKTITSNEPVAVIANLPYVDKTWEASPETTFEPDQALFAEDDGLKLIKKLILQASKKLRTDDWLILEADPRQHEAMTKYAEKHGFRLQKIDGFIALYRLRA